MYHASPAFFASSRICSAMAICARPSTRSAGTRMLARPPRSNSAIKPRTQRARVFLTAAAAAACGSITSFPFAPSGGRLFRGPETADSPIKGHTDSGAHQSAFSSTTDGSRIVQTMDRSLLATQWKPADTGGNRVVAERDFGGVIEVRLAMLEAALIARTSFTGCLNECLRHDGREDQQIAGAIHISKGYLSKLLRSVWAAQVKRLVAFMRETKCLAPLQWMAEQVGCELVLRDSRAAEVAALTQRLRELQGRAA